MKNDEAGVWRAGLVGDPSPPGQQLAARKAGEAFRETGKILLPMRATVIRSLPLVSHVQRRTAGYEWRPGRCIR